MALEKLYKSIGTKMPKSVHNWLAQKLRFAGTDVSTEHWFGSRFAIIFLFSLLGALGYLVYSKKAYLVATGVFLVLMALLSLLVYVNLFFAITSRTKKVEEVLPDFLMLVVSNLHAGMVPFIAFVQAARPEFGPLYDEIKGAAARVGGKRSLDAALLDLSTRFDSELFKKSVNLFLKGIKSGGQLAKLLSENAEEIRRIQDLRAELITTTQTYTIFLAFIVVIVMPFLLGVSVNFLNTFTEIRSQVDRPDASASQAVAIFSGEFGITPEEMKSIGFVTLVITCLIASMFMGVVSSGKMLYGLKYYPILLIGSLIFFVLTQEVLRSLISIG